MGDHEHLDRLTRDQLAELDGPAHTVASVLDEWNHREHGLVSSHHNVGLFLDLLSAEGLQVTRDKTAANKIRDLRDVQGQDGTWNASGYMRGLYNGLELALSVLEGEREPQFRDGPSEQSV